MTNVMTPKDVERFFVENFRLPPENEQRVRGSRKVHIDICFEDHLQDRSRFLQEEGYDFVASEASFLSSELAMTHEYLGARIADFLCARQTDKGKLIVLFMKTFYESLGRQVTYGDLIAILAIRKKIPRVVLERWGTAEASQYEVSEAQKLSFKHAALQAFVQGMVGETVEAISKYATIELTTAVKARDLEIARNIARLDEIVGMAYFGLQDKPSLKGIAFIGAAHYSILDLVSDAMTTENVTVAIHPASIITAEFRQLNFLGSIFTVIKDELKLPYSLESAVQQAERLRGADALRSDLLKLIISELTHYIMPRIKLEQIDRDPLVTDRIEVGVAGQLTPEAIEELSRRIGESWFKGQQFPFSGNQKKKLLYVVNEFLASHNYRNIPSTALEIKAFKEAQVT